MFWGDYWRGLCAILVVFLSDFWGCFWRIFGGFMEVLLSDFGYMCVVEVVCVFMGDFEMFFGGV